MDETSIDDFLSDEAPAPEVVEEQPQQQDARPRDEHGRFAPKESPPDEGAPPAPEVDQSTIPVAALKAEREKRQALEAEVAALKQQFTPPKEPPPPPPSIWDDEQGWQTHFGSQVVTTAVQQASLNAKLDMSEMMVRQANPDFEEMKTTFLQLAEATPGIVQQALQDPHPWNKAYQIAKNHKTMQELGATNVDELRAKIREEVLAEQGQPASARPQIPVSLTNERNVGSRTGPAWSGPALLEDLLN